MIEVRGLTIGWGGEPLLEDLDFVVADGERFAILGGSGCGKSTLLRHLVGLEQPIAGTVRFDGEPVVLGDDRPPRAGVLFQSAALFGSLTLLENIAMPLRRWTELSRDAIEATSLGRLRLVGLGGYENFLPSEVSGGMRKRAGIARALALEPHLLLLDEPSSGLDPITASGLDRLLLTLNCDLGVTIVFVTHELQSIFDVAQRCIVIDRVRKGIVADGDPRVLRDTSADPIVRAFFHRVAEPA